MVYIIVLLLLILILLVLSTRDKIRLKSSEGADIQNPPENIAKNFRYVAWNGQYSLDAVGESNYQNSLCIIAGPKEEQSKSMDCHALLIREPDNEYDSNAIMVVIKGKLVGYLSKSNAASLVREMNKAFLGEDIIFVAKAKINGGWRDDRSEGNFGVVIDFSPMSKLVSVMSSLSMEDSEQKVVSIYARS